MGRLVNKFFLFSVAMLIAFGVWNRASLGVLAYDENGLEEDAPEKSGEFTNNNGDGNNVFTWEVNDGTLVVKCIEGRGEMPYYFVRPTKEEYVSVGIGKPPWSEWRESIHSITISNIARISAWAFSDMPDLYTILIDGILPYDIPPEAFMNCPNVENIKIIPSVSHEYKTVNGGFVIDDELVKGFDLMAPTIWRKDISRIGENAYLGCEKLTDIFIPLNVSSIGEYAFKDTGLVRVSIPLSLVEGSVGNEAFPESLEEIYFEGTEEQWEDFLGRQPDDCGLKGENITVNYQNYCRYELIYPDNIHAIDGRIPFFVGRESSFDVRDANISLVYNGTEKVQKVGEIAYNYVCFSDLNSIGYGDPFMIDISQANTVDMTVTVTEVVGDTNIEIVMSKDIRVDISPDCVSSAARIVKDVYNDDYVIDEFGFLARNIDRSLNRSDLKVYLVDSEGTQFSSIYLRYGLSSFYDGSLGAQSVGNVWGFVNNVEWPYTEDDFFGFRKGIGVSVHIEAPHQIFVEFPSGKYSVTCVDGYGNRWFTLTDVIEIVDSDDPNKSGDSEGNEQSSDSQESSGQNNENDNQNSNDSDGQKEDDVGGDEDDKKEEGAPITFKISYDLAGGALAAGATNPDIYDGKAAITLNNPVREGYTFAGWTGTGLDDLALTVTIQAGSAGDRSYTATWKEEEWQEYKAPLNDGDERVSEEDKKKLVRPVTVESEPVAASVSIKGENTSVSARTSYTNAVTYTGKKISIKEALKPDTDTSALVAAVTLNDGASPSQGDLFSISYVTGNSKVGAGTFYAKIAVKKTAKNYMSAKEVSGLKKLVKALNKELKKKANQCSYTINPLSITDCNARVLAKLKKGAIQTKADGSLKGLKKVTVKINGKTYKLGKSMYEISGADSESGTVRLKGRGNFTGTVTVTVNK